MVSVAKMLEKLTCPGVLKGHWLPGVRVSRRGEPLLDEAYPAIKRIDVPADPYQREQFVRHWMKKNQRAIKAGGLGSTLVLPLLAQTASANEPKVPVQDVLGVEQVVRQPNGSVTLLMQNGASVDIAAVYIALEDSEVVADLQALLESLGSQSGAHVPLNFLPQVETWQTLPDGNVEIVQPDGQRRTLNGDDVLQQGDSAHISPSQALQYGIAAPEDFSDLLIDQTESFDVNATPTSVEGSEAAASASSGWGVSPWVYVGGGALALGAAAGGGGGDGGDSGPSTISGYVIDGPIRDAIVTREVNGNERTTNDDGFFSGLQGSGGLIATGGVDIATDLDFTGTLRAPEDSTVITPLTTLMVASSEEDPEAAEAVILSALGLDESIDLRNTNPLDADDSNEALLVAGVKVASLLSMAQEAGIEADSVLANLYAAMGNAYGDGSRVENTDMAELLGKPSITGQVKEALDAIDKAGESFNVSAYRQGQNNPLSEQQRNTQDPDSDISDTIDARADIPYLTLQEALALAEEDALPSEYLIDPNKPLDGGTLGLTDAENQLAMVKAVLAGDYDVETSPIAREDIYSWSIRAEAEDVLVSGGLGSPEVEGATSVTLTNPTIRPDQFADLKTLDNFELGDTVVPYTLEEALETDEMPSNYTLDAGTPFPAGDLTVRAAAELIDETRQLLDLAQNTGADGLTRDQLLDWHIADSLANIQGESPARAQINEAESIRVTESIITPAEFVQLSALDNFVLGTTEVDYTLSQALDADPLASNYIIDLDDIYDAGDVTVTTAAAEYNDVISILDGANNQPPLTLFKWHVSDSADAIIPAIDQPHVTEADQVSARNRVIGSGQFEQLEMLNNFELGGTIVRYTLENAVNADTIAENYEIDTDILFEPGNVSVEVARTTLADVESILGGALNPQTPDADALFNWTVVDTAETILEALEDGNVPHLTRAEAVNVDNDIITIEQFETLSGAAFNYVRIDEQVEYTLDNAISIIDDGDGPLVDNYVIDLDIAFDKVWSVSQGESYFAIIDGAENKNDLLASESVVWQIEDSIDNLLAGISNVDLGDSEYDDDAILNAETVRATSGDILQTEYETLLAEVGDALRLDASATVSKTTVNYANLEAAVEAQAGDRLAPADFYTITPNATYENPNGPLSVADARTEIETIKSILSGSTNREPADFEELYDWGLTDSAGNILDAINSQTDLPEVLQGAGTIFAANGGDEGDILAEEYDALVAGLGKEGFEYNEVEYTLAYVFDSDSQPPAFAMPGDLADHYFFSADVFNINEALGETETISVAESEVYYNAVEQLLDGNTDTALAVTDIYEWNIVDSAEEFVTAYDDNNSQHPAHISDASLVEINDTTTITFDQYEVLENIPGFQIQEYTLEEAVNISLDANRDLATNFIIDTQSDYKAQDLSVTDAETYRDTVNRLIGDTGEAARNSQLDSANLDTLYSWTIEDSAQNILNQKSDSGFLPIVDEAASIRLTDESIVFEDDYLGGLKGLVGPSDLQNVRVDFFYGSSTDLSYIRLEGFEANYGILTNSNNPLEYLGDSDLGVSVSDAEDEYQRAFDVINNAASAPEGGVSSLAIWHIKDSVDSIDVNDPWVELAREIRLTETEFAAEQFLKFVDVNGEEVTVLNSLVTDNVTSVTFTPQEAYDNSVAFLAIATSNPGYVFDIEGGSVDFTAPFDVAEANELDAKLDELIAEAGAAPAKLDTYSWDVQDSVGSLLEEVNDELVVISDAGVQNAAEVRVIEGAISISQYEALSKLDAFIEDDLTVGYTLEEAFDRLPSEFGLADNYTLIDSAPFDIGELNAFDAERIYQLTERLANGAQNSGDVSVDSLLDWTVKDTLVGYEEIGVSSESNYLLEANDVFVIGSGDNGEIEDGDAQENREAFLGTGISYTEQVSSPVDSYTLSYLLRSDEELTDPVIDFSTGIGGDVFNIDLTTEELNALRGDDPNFDIYPETAETIEGTGPVFSLGQNVAFAVFTTAEFTGTDTTWLDQIGLENGEVAYLLAGNGETTDIDDDAQLYRVEETVDGLTTQKLADFESIALDSFTEENWNTSYDNQTG